MSGRARLFAMDRNGHATDEVVAVERLDDLVDAYRASPYASPKAPNRGSLHVQVTRWLTAPVHEGGRAGVRLSPPGLAALLERLR